MQNAKKRRIRSDKGPVDDTAVSLKMGDSNTPPETLFFKRQPTALKFISKPL